MKETICTVIGMVGGFIAALIGGWDSALVTLVIFMGVDFTTRTLYELANSLIYGDSNTKPDLNVLAMM